MRKFAAPVLAGLALTFGAYGSPDGMSLADGSMSLFSSLKQENHTVDPALGWVMAAGFLGLVVLRRTRSGPMA